MSQTELSRRHVVIGLAAAASAGTAAKAAEEPQEVRELLDLASRLPAAEGRHRQARAAVAKIADRWMPQWPEAPREAISFTEGSEMHRDILGRGIEMRIPPGATFKQAVRVGFPEAIKESAARHAAEADRLCRTKSKRGMKFHLHWAERDAAGVEPARSYWAEVARIKAASGIESAKAEENASREDLHALVSAIMAIEERTTRGLAIKADALRAWQTVGSFHVAFNAEGPAWLESLTDSVLRHAHA